MDCDIQVTETVRRKLMSYLDEDHRYTRVRRLSGSALPARGQNPTEATGANDFVCLQTKIARNFLHSLLMHNLKAESKKLSTAADILVVDRTPPLQANLSAGISGRSAF